MNIRIEPILGCLSRLVQVYSLLLTAERELVDCYLEGRLEDADANRTGQERMLFEVQRIHAELQAALAGADWNDLLATASQSDRHQLEDGLNRLHRTIAEASMVVRQNRRFVQNSASFCQGITQRAFAGTDSYNGQGVLRTPQSNLRGGMRV